MTTIPPVAKPLAIDVRVASEDLGYPVIVGSGMLDRLGKELLRFHGRPCNVALISDENVAALYGERATSSLEESGFRVVPLTIAPGEASKSPENLLSLVGQMLDAEMHRRDAVVTLGGGVVGDLGGLAAACFMRGIGFLQCATSLLAQVDASVGGKVAVDLPQGKNLFGAFHFPVAVVIDPGVLSTLPDRQIACGLAEMLKHGALFSPEHFEDIVAKADAIYSRESGVLGPLVAKSVGLKAACVSRDPLEHAEAGKGRVLLNLGHTVGHAIESASDYDLLHGEAVGLGLRAAARLSERKGLAEAGLENAVVQALEAVRLPTDLDPWLTGERGAAVEAGLAHDKKRVDSTVTYIALKALGAPQVIRLKPAEILGLLRPE